MTSLILHSVVTADPYAMVDDFVEEYRLKYQEEGPTAFWELLQTKGDAYSVRQYLTEWYALYRYATSTLWLIEPGQDMITTRSSSWKR